MKISIFSALLVGGLISSNCAEAQIYAHCNALLEHGITDITTQKSAKHSRSYRWHTNCGSDYSQSQDATIASAHARIFGIGAGGGSYNRSQYVESISRWCERNREFAILNQDLFDEARVISAPALAAWNQCQEVARKGVEITFSPQGEHASIVAFSIDSTLDSDLSYLGTKTTGYKCQDFIKRKDDGTELTADDQPLIRNANIHIVCERDDPGESRADDLVVRTYRFGAVSVLTSGPALPVSFPEVVETHLVAPPGAVLAFDREECPSGWTPFETGMGRVIVGAIPQELDAAVSANLKSNDEYRLNRTGGKEYNTDGVRPHSHTLHVTDHFQKGGKAEAVWHPNSNISGNLTNLSDASSVDESNVPPYVALLYCRRQ